MTDKGGSAFACASRNVRQKRMDLRDYFAGQALEGILSSGANMYEAPLNAEMAYRNAAAMIVERAKDRDPIITNAFTKGGTI